MVLTRFLTLGAASGSCCSGRWCEDGCDALGILENTYKPKPCFHYSQQIGFHTIKFLRLNTIYHIEDSSSSHYISVTCIIILNHFHPLQSGPIQSSPLQSDPIRSVPIQSLPFQSAPIRSHPILSGPLQSGPIHSIPVRSDTN